ncbi:alpha/beta hydrolase family protein [Actinomyces wuliandei]|uniref:alpha/beta hydrolase family protein n=1 Tax=Actinomyces wuliandei TaxID=2057743 RepID=UPI001FAB3209|nr:acyl-CoA thioester hydrolase/BAAT C-terminal domain-containing protein [Actinomyces wuliandei]
MCPHRPVRLLPRRTRSRGEPLRPTQAEITSGWVWVRAFPRRAARMVVTVCRAGCRRLARLLLGVLALVLLLLLLGAGLTEIWQIVLTLALGALVLAVSYDHRVMGGSIVLVLGLSLVGTLAGPRWSPAVFTAPLAPTTRDTGIGGQVETVPVGTYEVRTIQVSVPQADGQEVPALLRQPVGAPTPTAGVVFLHGAGTHTIEGFAEQAEALASAGATTIVPDKPMEGYTLTERDYVSMAADYADSVELLRSLEEVDALRVGLYAESEGGYPGVVLAAQDSRIAFLVLASAPVVPIRQQAAFAMDSYLREVGVPEPLLDIIPRILGSRELPGGGFKYADFDASVYERRLTVPVLMLYGTEDSSMPVLQGPRTVWDSMQEAGNDQLTVRYYAGANHGLKSGTSTEGLLVPGVARDLARWVTGLPETGGAGPRVAGAAPTQVYWAQVPERTRWYASGDLMLVTAVLGLGLLGLSAVLWGAGQLPRLRGGRGLHLPAPLGRWAVSLGLSVTSSWVLYLAYVLTVAQLALNRTSNLWISYGGWALAQGAALMTVVLLVKLVGRAWLMRGHVRQDGGGRWLTPWTGTVLVSALGGTLVQLMFLAYWGLFPLLL